MATPKVKIKKKLGRPTKYRARYCKDIIKFFDVPLCRKELVKKGVKELGTKDEYKWVANELPFLTAFARKIDVDIRTLEDWASKTNDKDELIYPDFSRAYKSAKAMQKEFLINNALAGRYNPTAFIFTAKNITDMRDEQVIKEVHTIEIDG